MNKKLSSSKSLFSFFSKSKNGIQQTTESHLQESSANDLEGNLGQTISLLCKTGLVQIGDRTYEAISATSSIGIGEKIIVMGKSFGLLVVRPVA